jgi:hypothetical protein
MKIVPVNYVYGGMSLEIIGETPVETALLHEIFAHGEMTVGCGNSENANGSVSGFYLRLKKAEP